MKYIEDKIRQKYLKMIKKSVINKYKTKAHNEALESKMYLDKEDNTRQFGFLKRQIYQTYMPLIDEEISYRLNEALNSPRFSKAVEAEKALKKKTLHYKSLRRYQQQPIHITTEFLNLLSEEVNRHAPQDDIISINELRYLTLTILYAIIDYIRDGYKIKFGTLFRIWCEKRDFVSNLPLGEHKIKEDYLFPKVKLCKVFDNLLFNKINEDNEAIMNYYKSKIERLLILLKIKKANDE